MSLQSALKRLPDLTSRSNIPQKESNSFVAFSIERAFAPCLSRRLSSGALLSPRAGSSTFFLLQARNSFFRPGQLALRVRAIPGKVGLCSRVQSASKKISDNRMGKQSDLPLDLSENVLLPSKRASASLQRNAVSSSGRFLYLHSSGIAFRLQGEDQL